MSSLSRLQVYFVLWRTQVCLLHTGCFLCLECTPLQFHMTPFLSLRPSANFSLEKPPLVTLHHVLCFIFFIVLIVLEFVKPTRAESSVLVTGQKVPARNRPLKHHQVDSHCSLAWNALPHLLHGFKCSPSFKITSKCRHLPGAFPVCLCHREGWTGGPPAFD